MRIPCATYRLQFNSEFGFRKAQAVVAYLSELGISDIYASPIFAARKGSIHGYDVVDPTRLNPDLGSQKDFQALVGAVQSHGMGWLQDIVPNHMAVDGANLMLMDVLEHGRASECYDFFDIDWDHTYESMKGRLLAPFLGRSYCECLEDGEIKVKYGETGFTVHYYQWKFPLRIESCVRILSDRLDTLKRRLGADHPDFVKFMGTLYVLKAFPSQESAVERYEQIRFAKCMLWELYQGNREIKRFINANLRRVNGQMEPKNYNLLDEILTSQFFRLSFWKVASEEINYRRFFNINELIALRMECPEAFRRCHSLIRTLVRKGVFSGLRIDHIDGQYDPLQYLQRIQEHTGGIYLIVEKVLAADEPLHPLWPVQGTTGYEFLNAVNGVLYQNAHTPQLDRIYTGFTGARTDYPNLLYEKKKLIIERYMTGDVDNLAHLMKRFSSRERSGADITLYGLKRAIHEVLALFPVYRTFVSPQSFTEVDRNYIAQAVAWAKQRNPDLLYELDYLNKLLQLQSQDYLDAEQIADRIHFTMKFQQFTGPLMAKGFEDTTLYVYNRLISLNEVGGDPYNFQISLDQFHDFNRMRSENWPHALSATSTHDTKRGEDARARINVLSEIPREWEARVQTWRKINAPRKKQRKRRKVPNRNDEYFFYQTLIGAFPFVADEIPAFSSRLKDYIRKAIREAKVHTGWLKPDTDYEEAFLVFIDAVLSTTGKNRFLEDFLPFQRKVAHYGILNSLSQTLLKITAPGVPDFYQGSELWELHFVDPDNRRPVDFTRRQAYLKEIRREQAGAKFLAQLLATPETGQIKQFLIHRALKTRTAHQELFEAGSYLPVATAGIHKERVVAFARRHDESWAVIVVPRFMAEVVEETEYPLGAELWRDTVLILPPSAPSRWRESVVPQTVETQGEVPVAQILSRFPVALLVNDAARLTDRPPVCA